MQTAQIAREQQVQVAGPSSAKEGVALAERQKQIAVADQEAAEGAEPKSTALQSRRVA